MSSLFESLHLQISSKTSPQFKTPSYAKAIHCQKCCDNAWAYLHLVVQWATSTGVVGRRMSTSGWRIPLDSACDSIRFSDLRLRNWAWKNTMERFYHLLSSFNLLLTSTDMNSQFWSSSWVVSDPFERSIENVLLMHVDALIFVLTKAHPAAAWWYSII